MDTYWSIGEAWLATYQDCLNRGRTYTIQRGSFVGQQRRQLDALAFTILRPETRPLGVTFGGVAISDDASIETYYLNYLINPTVAENESYTYASRIAPHLESVATMLRETPHTNQAFIPVAQPGDHLLADPPCLQCLTWKATANGLQLSSYWRSWDIYVALATNLGGLELLNEMMAEWAGLAPGHLVAYSDGAHVYGYAW